MVSVTKEFTFDAAHMLAGHDGLCQNLHGHTYKVHVTVSRKTGLISSGSSAEMVVDFKDLKTILNKALFDQLDHAYIREANGKDSTEDKLFRRIDNLGLKVYEMPGRPTAENMVIHFYEKIVEALRYSGLGIEVLKIVVWETPTSFAEFTPAVGGIYTGGIYAGE